MTTEEGHLSIEAMVHVNDETLRVTAQASTDLLDWSFDVVELEGVDQSEVPEGFQRRVWRARYSATDGNRLFMRLKVD